MATDPKYRAGQTMDGRTICGAKKRSTGDPCGAPPRKGATRCARHGANARQVQLKAKRELARQEMIRAMTTLGLPVDIDPAKALLDEIAWTAGHVAWLREKVQGLGELDTLTRGTDDKTTWSKDGDEIFTEGSDASGKPGAHALVWGQTEYRDKTGGDDAGQTVVEMATLNKWYEMYVAERKHLVQTTAIALRAGIEERRVKLAESQGDLVAGAIRNILDALGLTDEQLARVPEIVPRALRALQDGAIPGELVS